MPAEIKKRLAHKSKGGADSHDDGAEGNVGHCGTALSSVAAVARATVTRAAGVVGLCYYHGFALGYQDQHPGRERGVWMGGIKDGEARIVV